MNKAPLIVALSFLTLSLATAQGPALSRLNFLFSLEPTITITDFETGSIETDTFQPRTEFAEGAPIRVRVKIDPNSTFGLIPKLAVGVPPNGPFQPAVEMTHTTGNMYEATLNGQHYGAYQLQLTVSYHLRLQGTLSAEQLLHSQRSKTRSRPFFVEAPAGCFAFDTTPDPEGWTLEGLFAGETPTHVETCKQADLNRLFSWQSGMTFPASSSVNPAEGHGSIQLLAGLGCFPGNPSGKKDKTDFWWLDFVSPNLVSRAEWQGISGFSARVNPGAIRLITRLWAQPLINVRDSEGATTIRRPVDVNWGITPLTDDWTVISFDYANLPAGSTVLNVRVRLFIEPVNWGDVLLLRAMFLDGVCPIRH